MYKVDGVAEAYKVLSKELLYNSSTVYPRGMETREILTPIVHIENPRSRLAFLEERKFNVVYAMVESLMLFSHNNEVKYLERFNSNIKQFSDDGVHMYGSYGFRIAQFIPEIINKLKSDKDSRQAALTIYNNDLIANTKDTPCTLNLHFIIRDDRLNMVVYMRSNDIIWGFPYDVFMFTMLQEVIANSLGIDLGWYRHVPTSLHVYSNHYDLLDIMGGSEEVLFNNPFDYLEYKVLAKNYKHIIDEKDSGMHHINIKVEKLLEYYLYRNIFINELLYKGEKILHNEYMECPKWTEKFTSKWGIDSKLYY